MPNKPLTTKITNCNFRKTSRIEKVPTFLSSYWLAQFDFMKTKKKHSFWF
jgi:hypothetical protein